MIFYIILVFCSFWFLVVNLFGSWFFCFSVYICSFFSCLEEAGGTGQSRSLGSPKLVILDVSNGYLIGACVSGGARKSPKV